MSILSFKFIAVLAVSTACTGCATMTRGFNEQVDIISVPAGAQVTTDADKKGRVYTCAPTPCGISLPRRAAPLVTVSMPGYQSINFKLVSSGATSASSVKPGTTVAGTKPGSYVVAGSPKILKRIPGGVLAFSSIVFTAGAGTIFDYATGATQTLSPNPVTVFLAPSADNSDDGS